jgi:AcrR family transcriptional regulator
MSRIANVGSAGRAYRSPLRAEQAEETRSRILDAAMRVMADGVATLSIPAVAREAAVSVPTVYRHFRTKGDLFTALYPHAERRAGLGALPVPRSLDEVGAAVRAICERIESFDDLVRAAIASPAAEEARRLSMPQRFEYGRRLVADAAPELAPEDRDRIARLVAVLLTSSSLRSWRDHLGASVDQVADDIDWVLRAALAAARSDR